MTHIFSNFLSSFTYKDITNRSHIPSVVMHAMKYFDFKLISDRPLNGWFHMISHDSFKPITRNLTNNAQSSMNDSLNAVQLYPFFSPFRFN